MWWCAVCGVCAWGVMYFGVFSIWYVDMYCVRVQMGEVSFMVLCAVQCGCKVWLMTDRSSTAVAGSSTGNRRLVQGDPFITWGGWRVTDRGSTAVGG